MTTTRVQHRATLSVSGRQVDIHAPPFMPEAQLESWLAETLRNEGVTLVSKTWATPTTPDQLDLYPSNEIAR